MKRITIGRTSDVVGYPQLRNGFIGHDDAADLEVLIAITKKIT